MHTRTVALEGGIGGPIGEVAGDEVVCPATGPRDDDGAVGLDGEVPGAVIEAEIRDHLAVAVEAGVQVAVGRNGRRRVEHGGKQQGDDPDGRP
jgi:hypothetical protein